jgi:hypothetical protein
LIDYGLASRYKNENNIHLDKETKDDFKGSLEFASKNAFDFVKTSRRDDLISLCYLLIYCLDNKSHSFL